LSNSVFQAVFANPARKNVYVSLTCYFTRTYSRKARLTGAHWAQSSHRSTQNHFLRRVVLCDPRVPASPTLVLGCQKLPEELRCLSVLFRRLYATQ
jgi:hypothetical protein